MGLALFYLGLGLKLTYIVALFAYREVQVLEIECGWDLGADLPTQNRRRLS